MLRPGQFARVELSGGPPAAIVVPQRAVLEGPKGKIVMTVNAQGVVEPRPVQVGDWSGEDWVITGGLKPGDQVIVDGVVKARPGSPVKIAQRRLPPPAGPARLTAASQARRQREPSNREPTHVFRFFIDRPIFAAVLSLFIVLAGLAAMRTLPIAQYPEIAPPVVTVRAVYPGASAEVLEQTVAAPLENQINGVENMLYMSSNSSSNGVVEIQVTFDIGTNVDQAALNVNNRVKQAEPRLPQEVRRQGVTVEKGSSSFLQVLAFYSPDGTFDDLYISNYVTLNVLDSIKRIPGHDQRADLRRQGLRDAHLAAARPHDAVEAHHGRSDPRAERAERAVRRGQGRPGADRRPAGAGVHHHHQGPARRSARVREHHRARQPRRLDAAPEGRGARRARLQGLRLHRPRQRQAATLVGIFLQPGANALDVAKEVQDDEGDLPGLFPKGFTYSVPYDTTRFVEVSIREVVKTLAEAMALVFLVVFLFLQNWRATLIPFAAVPVSLIGTFAGLFLLGYSINTLTLFGMVLAIGIVVDDAIVVLENVERIMHEEHLAARDAAIKAMSEVTGPIIAIVLTLCAVFVPIAFLGGLTGELYRQFAVTISIAVVISGMVALTLTPEPVRADPEARA